MLRLCVPGVVFRSFRRHSSEAVVGVVGAVLPGVLQMAFGDMEEGEDLLVSACVVVGQLRLLRS